MDNIHRFRILNKLKQVERITSVGKRKENSAEHTWSALMLADYYMEKFNFNVNKHKVLELLMYHDVVEIIAGDTALEPGSDRTEKMQKEMAAADDLKKELPKPMGGKFHKLFMEYENMKTIESKLAKAIDALDVIIHEIDYKKDWKGWSREFLIKKKAHYFEPFQQIQEDFYKLLDYLEAEGYFNQK